MPSNKIQTGIRFDDTTRRKLTYIAKKNHRSFNAQMEYLAEQCIQAYEQEHGEIPLEETEDTLRG